MFPREATAPTNYGPNVRAAALYLLHGQHLSVERTAEAMSAMLGADVSTGFVASLAREAAGGLTGFVEEIRQRLRDAALVHVDETSDQVETDKWWFHVVSNELYAYLFASPTRGKDAPDEAGVLGAFGAVSAIHEGAWTAIDYTCDGTAVEVDAFRRAHARVELAIKDLKEGAGMEHVPSGNFSANAAWLVCAALAHDLIRWSALLGEITPEDHLVVARMVRTRYPSVPGRLVNISGTPTLRAPLEWPWAKKFERALDRLRALPPVPV